jgi:hypothetical protein
MPFLHDNAVVQLLKDWEKGSVDGVEENQIACTK